VIKKSLRRWSQEAEETLKEFLESTDNWLSDEQEAENREIVDLFGLVWEQQPHLDHEHIKRDDCGL